MNRLVQIFLSAFEYLFVTLLEPNCLDLPWRLVGGSSLKP
jgi:hypothetical protein